jgi:hypothetical protein
LWKQVYKEKPLFETGAFLLSISII